MVIGADIRHLAAIAGSLDSTTSPGGQKVLELRGARKGALDFSQLDYISSGRREVAHWATQPGYLLTDVATSPAEYC